MDPSIRHVNQATSAINCHQGLYATQHMQQAFTILQLPITEMRAALTEIVLDNPLVEFLDEEEIDFVDERPFLLPQSIYASYNELPEREPSLYEALVLQAKESGLSSKELKTCIELLGYIDKYGFLKESRESLSEVMGVSHRVIKRLVTLIQTFDPAGVGAVDLRETLLLQLKRKGLEGRLSYKIVKYYFSLLLNNQIPVMVKKLKVSFSEITEAYQEIAQLNRHPFEAEEPIYLQADIEIDCVDLENLVIRVQEPYSKCFQLNEKYLKILRSSSASNQEKRYLKSKWAQVKWLLRNLDERNKTLYRIGEVLIEKQREYFLGHTHSLKPLTIKQVAEKLNMAESTIARACAHKSLKSIWGLVPLSHFFSISYQGTEEGDVCSLNDLLRMIDRMIQDENKRHPFSDREISERLSQQGVKCARRTVSKLRQKLLIGKSSLRKRY